MLILGCAPLLAATVYMTLDRFARALRAEKYTIIRLRWVTKIYVLIDIASFVCQMAGSAMQTSNDPSGVQLGQHIVIGGLIVQLIALGWFIFETSILHIRLSNGPTAITLKDPSISWKPTLWTVRCVSVLIFIRSLYRLIEFVGGSDSTFAKHEVFLYIFDASLLSISVFLFVVVHPGRLFKKCHRLGAHLSDGEGAGMLREISWDDYSLCRFMACTYWNCHISVERCTFSMCLKRFKRSNREKQFEWINRNEIMLATCIL